MKRLYGTLNIFFLLCISLQLVAETGSFHGSVNLINLEYQKSDDKGKSLIYVVGQGETSYSIAKKFGIPLKELYRLNPQSEVNLQIGDQLIIPQIEKIEKKSYKPEKGETIYSISKKFNTTVEDILNLNPKLGTDGLKEGKSIKVPVAVYYKIDVPKNQTGTTVTRATNASVHKVKPKETIYGISKHYNISESRLISANPQLNNGLKTGMELVIPVNIATSNKDAGMTLVKKDEPKQNIALSTIKIGVLLPFLDKNEKRNERYIEYYEGLLLAVNDLKADGYSLDIYTFDIGADSESKKLKGLLETNDIATLNMIIGGETQEQIRILSDYTKQKGMKYVIPFPNKVESTLKNECLFQFAIPHSALYPKISRYFVKNYSSDNIIFISDKSTDDKANFVKQLSNKLDDNSLSYKIVLLDKNFEESLSNVLSITKRNVIIPSSSSFNTLVKILVPIKSIIHKDPDMNITFFGYPDWQAYTQLYSDFMTFDTQIYSSFFVQQNSNKDAFEAKYKKAYNKEMSNSFPKYAMMGYDATVYFAKTFKEYGVHFENNLHKIKYTPLQTAFYFVQPQQGAGYLNEGLYIIRFSNSGTGIDRKDISEQ